MKPTYEDNHITLYGKSCLDMAEIEDETVQMVVTSPPYWGLRKYSGDQDLIWGGDGECDHEWTTTTSTREEFRRSGHIDEDFANFNRKDHPDWCPAVASSAVPGVVVMDLSQPLKCTLTIRLRY